MLHTLSSDARTVLGLAVMNIPMLLGFLMIAWDRRIRTRRTRRLALVSISR